MWTELVHVRLRWLLKYIVIWVARRKSNHRTPRSVQRPVTGLVIQWEYDWMIAFERSWTFMNFIISHYFLNLLNISTNCLSFRTMFQRRPIWPNRLEYLAGLYRRPYSISGRFSALSKDLIICTLLTFSDAIAHSILCDCSLSTSFYCNEPVSYIVTMRWWRLMA